MNLSENSYNIFAEFYRQSEYFSDIEFPKPKVFARKGAWLLTNLLLIDGITLGKNIFVNPKFVWRDDSKKLRIRQKLLAHELAHVLQYKRQGYFRFLVIYMKDFWKLFRSKPKWNLRTWFESYYDLPQEKEAREFADDFIAWLEASKENK